MTEQPQEVKSDQKEEANKEELLTFSDQKVVVAICCALLLWAGWQAISLSRWGSEEIEIHRQVPFETSYLIDINKANWLEFAMLEGIGEVLAKKIIVYRESQGDFSTVQDLRNVNGIGKITFEKIRSHLVIQPLSKKQ